MSGQSEQMFDKLNKNKTNLLLGSLKNIRKFRGIHFQGLK